MTALDQIMSRGGVFVPEPRDLLTDSGAPTAALRKWAADRGYEGRHGGWIYNGRGEAFTQGWFNFASMMIRAGKLREDETMRTVAKAARVRRLRSAAAHRRGLLADLNPTTFARERQRWESEVRYFDDQADAIEKLPVVAS